MVILCNDKEAENLYNENLCYREIKINEGWGLIPNGIIFIKKIEFECTPTGLFLIKIMWEEQ